MVSSAAGSTSGGKATVPPMLIFRPYSRLRFTSGVLLRNLRDTPNEHNVPTTIRHPDHPRDARESAGALLGHSAAESAERELQSQQPGQGDLPTTGYTKAEVVCTMSHRRAVSPLHRRPGAESRPVPRRGGRTKLLREERARRHARLGQDGAHPNQGRTISTSSPTRQATVVWLANLAALEMHVPQWRVGGSSPNGEGKPRRTGVGEPLADRVVVDLDPGEGTTIVEIAQRPSSRRALGRQV